MAKTRRARIDAENDHRRVTRPRLRIIVKETRSIPTDYLRAPPDTIEYDRGSRKVSGSRADHEAVTIVVDKGIDIPEAKNGGKGVEVQRPSQAPARQGTKA